MKPIQIGAVALIMSLVMSCKTSNLTDESETKYLLYSKNDSGLMRHIFKPSIDVCMEWKYNSTTPQQKTQMKNSVAKALGAWLQPLRKRNPKVTNTMRFSCPGYVKVTLTPNFKREYRHRNAQCHQGTYPHIEIRNFDHLYFRLMLHEFGHAFGLKDTYLYYSDRCKPGQPLSVMCSNRMTRLYKDDIAGLNAMYDLLYPPGFTPITEGNELKLGLIVKGLASDGKF